MIKNVFVLLMLVLVASCGQDDPNKNVEEGKLEDEVYTSEEIGWRIVIPKGYALVDLRTKREKDKRGQELIKETTGVKLDNSQLKNLLAFKKDRLNVFYSTSEPFDETVTGWEENQKMIKELVYTAYVNKGIPADSSALTVEMVDGLEFHTFLMTIYDQEGEPILKQKNYGRLINGVYFGVHISYNNDQCGNEMMRAFKKSKFRKV